MSRERHIDIDINIGFASADESGFPGAQRRCSDARVPSFSLGEIMIFLIVEPCFSISWLDVRASSLLSLFLSTGRREECHFPACDYANLHAPRGEARIVSYEFPEPSDSFRIPNQVSCARQSRSGTFHNAGLFRFPKQRRPQPTEILILNQRSKRRAGPVV